MPISVCRSGSSLPLSITLFICLPSPRPMVFIVNAFSEIGLLRQMRSRKALIVPITGKAPKYLRQAKRQTAAVVIAAQATLPLLKLYFITSFIISSHCRFAQLMVHNIVSCRFRLSSPQTAIPCFFKTTRYGVEKQMLHPPQSRSVHFLNYLCLLTF